MLPILNLNYENKHFITRKGSVVIFFDSLDYYFVIKLSVFIGDNIISLQSVTTEKTKVELIYFRNAGGFFRDENYF